jgi:hypothetical protein
MVEEKDPAKKEFQTIDSMTATHSVFKPKVEAIIKAVATILHS